MAQAINAPAAFVFALTLALANPDPVDYNSNKGMKLCKSATEKLNHTFDGETGSLCLFLQALQQRADASILTVPDDQNIGRNLITDGNHFGLQCRGHECYNKGEIGASL